MLLHHVQPTDRLAPAVKTERPLSQTSNQLLHSGAASGHRPQQAPWPAAAAAISQLKGAATALAVPGFWMLELFLSARIFALISLLFVAPTVWDLLRQASVTNSRPGFGLRCTASLGLIPPACMSMTLAYAAIHTRPWRACSHTFMQLPCIRHISHKACMGHTQSVWEGTCS